MGRNAVKKQIAKDTVGYVYFTLLAVIQVFSVSRRRVEQHPPMASNSAGTSSAVVVDAACSAADLCSSSEVIVTTDSSADTGRSMRTATPTVHSAGADSCSSSEVIVTTGTSADELRTGHSMRSATPTVHSAEVPPQSSATAADECLMVVDGLPSARRSNPTTAILTKVDSANALKHEGSILYSKEGHWVVELIERIAESVAPSTTQFMGVTNPNNGVIHKQRVAYA